MLGDVILQLDVVLDDAEHGYCYRGAVKHGNPDMSKRWTQRVDAVVIRSLGNDGNEGHEDVDEAVLEDAHPDDLRELVRRREKEQLSKDVR